MYDDRSAQERTSSPAAWHAGAAWSLDRRSVTRVADAVPTQVTAAPVRRGTAAAVRDAGATRARLTASRATRATSWMPISRVTAQMMALDDVGRALAPSRPRRRPLRAAARRIATLLWR